MMDNNKPGEQKPQSQQGQNKPEEKKDEPSGTEA